MSEDYVFDADEVELRPGMITVPSDWYVGVMKAQSFFDLPDSGCTQFVGIYKITEGDFSGTELQDRGLYATPEEEGTEAYEKHMKGIKYTKQKLKTLAIALDKPRIRKWEEWFDQPVKMKVIKKESMYKGQQREENEIQVFKRVTEEAQATEGETDFWDE